MNPRPRILAIQHVAVVDGIRLTPVVLDRPPVAVVSPLEAVIHGWWYRSGGYPVGRIFGTLIAALTGAEGVRVEGTVMQED